MEDIDVIGVRLPRDWAEILHKLKMAASLITRMTVTAQKNFFGNLKWWIMVVRGLLIIDYDIHNSSFAYFQNGVH